MLKNNTQDTMRKNLKNAHEAGIWNHTFVFFGFPTETEREAEETIEFMLSNSDIVDSEGAGTFSFEHNAPIYHDPVRFGVKSIREKPASVLELYYNYETTHGLDAEGAQRALRRFNELKLKRGAYSYGRWIPREFLLLLLSYFERDRLKEEMGRCESVKKGSALANESLRGLSLPTRGESAKHFIVNRTSGQVFETNKDAVTLLSMVGSGVSVDELTAAFPSLSPLRTFNDESEVIDLSRSL
jgi:anaerobic magnesium-protoporphyrin IX monomethyl ester cyclase